MQSKSMDWFLYDNGLLKGLKQKIVCDGRLEKHKR